ncbi:scavenger receptor cysteine-rich type 1 M130-like protein [Labeo rohita]|uniref:Scavenger receptor cysteine-rich type 1 M130-like protein n=1 Tax=Labeo rohita TaxID=84645 RepID=A0A498NXK7_LABRO|nr:scavenger receptor cysteine-rich type 1 M130-like protein [Labeo rohita]
MSPNLRSLVPTTVSLCDAEKLGCGSVLNFYGSSSSSPEHSHECVTGFQCSGSEAHLGNCSSPQTLNCSSTQQLSITCTEFKEIRLTEGCEGNVEVFYNGSWGNLCSNQMDRDTASLICQDLNCGRSDFSVSTTPATTTSASPVSPPVHSTSVSPPQTSPAVSPQSSVPSVLVIVLVVVLLLLLVPLLILIQQNRVMRRALSKRRHGTTTEAVYEEIQHKPSNRHSLFTQRGSALSEVQHSGYEDADKLLSGVTPDYNNKVTTTKDTKEFKEIRLTEGCDGNVEVFYNGSWGNVCYHKMDRDTASLICQELNCGKSGVLSDSTPRLKSAHNWLDKVTCRQHDSSLWQCPSSPWGQNDCDRDKVAQITCLENESQESPQSYLTCSTAPYQRQCSDSSLALHDGLVRLSGERQCEGEVEVFIHQVWRRVLLDSWSLTESSVVCRQLGCGSVLNFYGSSSSSPEHSHECVTGFQCSGSEAHLGNCSSPQTLNCSSTQQLSITCLARLKSAPNWLDKVTCRPHDSTVWQCPSSPWGQNDCGEDEVARITCSVEESDESPRSRLTFSASPHQRQCSNLTDLSVSTTPATTTSASLPVSTPVHSTSVTLPKTPPEVSLSVPPVFVIVLVVVLLLLLVPLLILIQRNRVMRRALSKRRHMMTTEAVYEEIQHRHNHFIQRGVILYYNDVTMGLTADVSESYDDVVIIRQLSDNKAEGDLEEYDDVMNVCENLRDLSDWFGEGSGEIWADVFDCDGNETKLSECSISSWSRAECSHRRDVGVICSNSSVALHDGLVRLSGERQCEGEVEVFIHQVWRRVLLDSWSLTESSVVCRQLGCGSVLNFNGSSSSSPEHSHECVTGFQCSGSEAHLGNCSSPQTLNCSSTQQLSITCLDLPNLLVATTPATTTFASSPASPPISPPVLSTSVSPPQTPPAVSLSIPTELVIVLVVVLLLLLVPLLILIQQNRVMRRALSKRRHRTTTEAVYEEIQRKPTNRHSLFTQRGSVLAEEQHSGYEDADELLSEEQKVTPENYDDVVTVGLRHYHDAVPENYDDVIIVPQFCSNNAGVLRNPRWITFNSVHSNSAMELQRCLFIYLSALLTLNAADWFGEGSGEIRADVFDCDGNETKLSECSISSWSRAECSHKRDVGVICSNSSLALHDGLVRLSGERQCEGEVEVFSDQVWRRVLLDSWSLTESSVVCRQLGCGSVLNFYGSSSSSPEHSHECVTGFQCSGSEAHLGNCSSPQTLNCSSTQQLSITCLEFKEIRLTEGCEGNVEVFYNGSWGNLCYYKMDRDTASLICQELNCGRSGSEPKNSVGLKPHNWLDFFKCRRHDSTLWQCPSSPWGQNDCNNEVAKITCSDLSVSTTPATTSASPPVSPPVRSILVSPPQTPPAASLSVPPVLVIVLGVVLFLLLVPLLILIQQNRVMRRALADWYTGLHRTQSQTEPVYEEIYNRHNQFSRRGSLISEDAAELLTEDRVNEITPAIYEDIFTGGLIPDCETDHTPEGYYDVITSGQNNGTEKEGDQEEYDDAWSITEDTGLEREIWADVFDCDGNETKLSECSISSWSRAECSHRRDVGVICSDSSLALRDGLVRLSGERQCEGEVEVFSDQVWRRVLLDSWSLTESSVVCRQLGCGSVLNFYGSTQQLSITCLGSVLAEEQHSGYEDADELLSEEQKVTPENYDDVVTVGLRHYHSTDAVPENYDDVIIVPQFCSDNADSSLALYDGLVRLSGERQCEGEVEVFIHQVWRRVLLDSWSLTESSVVCRQLGCGSVLNFYGSSSSSPEHSHECVTGFQCSGSEAHLGNCSSPQTLNCSSTQQLSITCLEFKEIRLTEGCEGIVEVFYNGSWGNVCHKKMNRDTASLICQELNCGRSGSEIRYSEGLKSHYWLNLFNCRRHDSSIWQCPSSPWGQNDCDNEVAKITCSEEKSHESPQRQLTCSASPYQRQCSRSLNSVYEDIDELFKVNEITPGDYDDVIIDGLKPDQETDNTPEGDYDDVIITGQNYVGTPENYDDVIIDGQCSQCVTESDQGDYDDVENSNEDERNLLEFKEIRLTEGCEGNVEIFYNGSWGNVCYHKMDRDTVSLICQELNCGRSGVMSDSTTRLKSAPNWLDKVTCRQHDSSLWQCPSSPWGQNDCDGDKVAKITCLENESHEFPRSYLTCSTVPYQRQCSGVTPYYNDVTTGPTGDISESYDDVVIIRQLSNNKAEGDLEEYDDVMNADMRDLSGSSLALHDGLVRLSGERQCEGEVEVCIHQVWRRVLLDSWSLTESSVVCRQPGCGSVLNFYGTSSSSPEHSHECVTGFQCSGSEAHLGNCSSPQTLNCSSTQQLSITCLEGDLEEYDDVINASEDVRDLSDSSLALHDGLVRLSGERQCEGEVEVFIHQVWRRVLLDSWSLTESSVVCRQLGCGSVLNFYGSSLSSPEHSHECVTGFQCSGSEAHLGNCSSPQTLNCSSTQQLSVTCLEFKEIRLTEGCEGNVEVFYNGSWGNVCWNQMDRDTVSLICQELNCGRSGDFSASVSRVKSAPNWLDKVTCRPHDSSLWQCPSSPWGQNNCGEDEVVKITCSDLPDLSVFTTPATTTSASPPVSPPVRSTSVSPPHTSPAVSPQSSVPSVLVIVLVVVLLLLLVPLLILIQQNRVMRRALSKRRHMMTTEAVYEEIQHKPTNRHSLFTQRGSVVSTKRNSGYEDADELLSDDLPENYDDVVIVRQFCNDKADYDDVEEDPIKQGGTK